jgi:glycosyltransferase involved in cell wall biosynthesis
VAIPSASSQIHRERSAGDLITAPPRPDSAGRAPAVLQVVPALEVGGVERGTVEVAAALAAAGWRAVVASAGGGLVAELERAGARHVLLPLATKNPLRLAANARRLARLIRREEIDLVHARSRAPAWSAMIAAHRTQRPFVTTFHNAYGAGSWPKRRYNSVMARGDRVIAISHFVAAHAAATYGVPADRLRVIARGVDLDQFDPEQVGARRAAELARGWGLVEGVPVVMLPGRLTSWKGHGVLIEALGRLGRRDLAAVFVGGGAESYRAALERRIEESGLAATCRLVGHGADMPAAYRLADVVVSASTRPEGFGRVIVEALAMGCLVIATDHGGAGEILRGRDLGWLVPPGDPAALAAALAEALALDPAARRERAGRGLALVRDRFSRARMTGLTLAVYRELLGVEAAPWGAAP